MWTEAAQGVVDWEHFIEIWRLYQSAQFVHLFAMHEDWWADTGLLKSDRLGRIKPGQLLDVTGVLFTMTELFVFASRLAEVLNFGPEVTVSYTLFGLEGRQLQTVDHRRMPLRDYRKAATELTHFGYQLTVPAGKLIASAPELAVDETMRVYERFHWDPARQSLVDDQRKLLERRL